MNMRKPKHKYTPEEIQFLEDNVAGRSCAEITDLFNEHFCQRGKEKLLSRQIRNVLIRNKIQTVRKLQHCFSPSEVRFLEQKTPRRSYVEICNLFNEHFGLALPTNKIENKIKAMGLKTGRDTRFHHGNIGNPHGNADMIKEWQFQRRNIAWNCLPLGTRKINNFGYVMVKTAKPDIWKKLHIVIWEAAHGPIPEGHVIIFADGNKSNFNIDNLLLVSRRELAIMNRKHLIFPNADATKAGLLMAKIILQTNDYKRWGKEGGRK
jgi:hypothetical protein